MFWKLNQSKTILFVVLVFLLAEDLGSNIFANAESIECNTFWTSPSYWTDNKYRCGGKDKDGAKFIYSCKWCGRGDGKFSSAYDCADSTGKVITTGSWDCDAGMDQDDDNKDRPIFCYRYNATRVAEPYTCKSRHLLQQCPLDLCKRVTSK
ncbi:uncharacterized protein MELLADRAFT_123894 [Melampsora larici-populina 98AG31]|uniref:Secreted protein n=1 Tax=Melampsora larici-populina (strain 98AG31 / pathotype 3-4-7) TaxID=747676 RepID=F4RHC3_MELLP|nr:uncharacterized protein MELLADRAFT_123894 [Melampsora larici-populina 98AG31]EGG08273.1 secreted protein [Melampsora larici-populina 98AG31]